MVINGLLRSKSMPNLINFINENIDLNTISDEYQLSKLNTTIKIVDQALIYHESTKTIGLYGRGRVDIIDQDECLPKINYCSKMSSQSMPNLINFDIDNGKFHNRNDNIKSRRTKKSKKSLWKRIKRFFGNNLSNVISYVHLLIEMLIFHYSNTV